MFDRNDSARPDTKARSRNEAETSKAELSQKTKNKTQEKKRKGDKRFAQEGSSSTKKPYRHEGSKPDDKNLINTARAFVDGRKELSKEVDLYIKTKKQIDEKWYDLADDDDLKSIYNDFLLLPIRSFWRV